MADYYPWLVVTPIFGLVGLKLCHFLLAWITGGRSAYGIVLKGFVGGLVVTLAASIFALMNMDFDWPNRIALLLFNLIIYGALGFGYINFVGLSIASLRIRLLQELLTSPEGLTRAKILERYNPQILINNRIARLTSGGQLVTRDDKFYNGRSGVLWIARVINVTKFLVLGKRRRRHD